jgi:tetratricopeptide (TPR) repeat protein
MKYFKCLVLIGFLFIYFQTSAQRRKSGNVLAQMNGQAGGSASVPSDYSGAEELAKTAVSELKAGNVKEAELKILKSIEMYPTTTVFEYARVQAALPDLNGANRLMDAAIERVQTFPKEYVMVQSPIPTKMVAGKMVGEVKSYQKVRAIFLFAQKALEVNQGIGERKWVLKSLAKVTENAFPEEKNGNFGYDYEYNMLIALRMQKAMMEGRFDEAFSIISSIPTSIYFLEETRSTYELSVLVAKRDYQGALKVVESLGKKAAYKDAYHGWMFSIHSMMGNADEALKHYKLYPAAYKENNGSYYNLGLIDLAKKDYAEAVKKFNTSIRLRGTNGMEVYGLVWAWEVYTGLANAYAGLKDYSKARDNYQIALLYHPEHTPAIDGLSKLEVRYATESATDKTAPVISITEPATRGLKVAAAGKTILVRGTALDPSGIKEVAMNGVRVYSQAGGDFWGDVSLKPGDNKIQITATDMAGNKAVHELDVRQTTTVASADIVPVTSAEGRNYALMIAAQNYSDSAIPSLENPVADAVRLKLILKNQYSFSEGNIVSLFNPTADDLRRQLLELTNTLQPEDNLVIFYAGHGIWVEKEKRGYWLMTDAVRNDINTWVPNKDVLDLIAKLPSRHTLLITDACFSGSVFKTRGLGKDAPAALKEIDNKISRVAITSGNDTEVPDESVFMKYLVKALSENQDKYLTAQKMFVTKIIEAVMSETSTEPRYGTLEMAGHVGGDFIFTKK